MPKHPSDGTLRRLLDEPVAVAVADEDHASQCLRCQARMGLMHEDDAAVSLGPWRPRRNAPAAIALERLHDRREGGASASIELQPGVGRAGRRGQGAPDVVGRCSARPR